MLRIENLKKSFGPNVALSGLDLAVSPGELFAFLGPNGAGKTTTIRILNGLSRLDSGLAAINGLDITAHPLAAKRLCGLVPQHANLDGELTVWENMDLHCRLYGLGRSERHRRTIEHLDYVDIADRAQSLVKTLSGGLKRRLMIARALSHGPRLLFLDEPTVGLDPAIRRRIWALIKKVNQDGVTIFLTTHYIEEAEFLAHRVGFVNNGLLVTEGSPQELMDRLGQWAVDVFGPEGPSTRFFAERALAGDFIQSLGQAGSVRRVNLEDAFLTLTGRRVTA
ncbi:MAG: ABC transporter ATP-binding protein [Deltaproteobacteria bacterium]|jgi:ABC-2 type transport system ATP-binding protein|nr:ABC transporter ATP-binding protein [Deltaproteobacteria bacterium]